MDGFCYCLVCKVDLFRLCGASAARRAHSHTYIRGAYRPETASHLMDGTCLEILSSNKQCQCAIVWLLGCVATALVSFQNRLHESHDVVNYYLMRVLVTHARTNQHNAGAPTRSHATVHLDRETPNAL